MPEKRKKAIRELILHCRPDVLFLQEVGSAAFLKELQLDLSASGFRYPFSAFSLAEGSRSGLAVLSQKPILQEVFHYPHDTPSSPPPLKRGIQEISVSLDSRTVRFFHVHLKSRFSPDPDDPDASRIRQAEIFNLAAFLRQQLQARPSQVMLIVGDFNALFDDPIMQPLRVDWMPLQVRDGNGLSWTYHHLKSGAMDRIDGFWFPRSQPPPLRPLQLLPLDSPPSDHRLVSAAFFF
jgi:endonuclease/exonuclease/phosphatase family metal-dependent hydrolase